MFATEAKTPIKTAWPQLSANNIILLPYLELSQQQSVPSKDPPHRQQQSHKCGPEKRFQQQPICPQRCRQTPYEGHQSAREPSSTEGPAGAVDRSRCSSTRGSCTERKERKSRPESTLTSHSTRPMAAIDIRAIDDDVYADVTKRFCEAHVPHSSHVSKAAHDVTTMHRSIITNLVHIKALRFFIRWTEPSAASALQPLLSNFKQNKSEKEGKKALKTASARVSQNISESHPFCSADSAKFHRTNTRSLCQGSTVSEVPGRQSANLQQVPFHDLLDARESTASTASATMTSSAAQPINTLPGPLLSWWIPQSGPCSGSTSSSTCNK